MRFHLGTFICLALFEWFIICPFVALITGPFFVYALALMLFITIGASTY